MTLDLDRLHWIIDKTTIAVHRDTNPSVTKGLVNVHFFLVKVNTFEAERCRAELVSLLEPLAERLKDGPSFIEVGAEVGDQGVALRLFGLGQYLGFWRVLTPRDIVLTDDEELIDRMAGNGFVFPTGYRP